MANTTKIKNTKTGFIANALTSEWESGVYDKNIWQPHQASTPTASVPSSNLQKMSSELANTGATTVPTTVSSNDLAPAETPDLTPEGYRKLGLKEFENYAAGWHGVGLTDKEIEENFLKRQGADIFLKKDAPTHESIIAGRPLEVSSGEEAGEGEQAPTNYLGQSTQDYLDRINQGLSTIDALDDRIREYQALMDSYKSANAATNLANAEEVAGVKEEYYEGKEGVENRVIPMSEIRKQITKLNEDTNERLAKIGDAQTLQAARDTYKQTQDAIQYNLLIGQYNDAQQLVNQTSDLLYKNQMLQLQYAQEQRMIDQFQYQVMRDEINAENDLMSQGLIYIKPENVKAMALQYGAINIKTNPVTGKSYIALEDMDNNILSSSGAKTFKGEEKIEEPLSINQIEQFRRSYGWTPPYGFTKGQLEQYITDNPGATPEELEAGAKQVAGETGLSGSDTKTPETEIDVDSSITEIMNSLTDAQLKSLKTLADKAGISSMWRSKKTDVKNYLKSIKSQIEEALRENYTIEEIIKHLTS